MEGLNIDWNAMVNNTKFDPIPMTPSGTFSQESMDKAIESLGKIGGVYTRKDMLSKDPQLEAMKEQLNKLYAERDKKVEQLRLLEDSEQFNAYESAKNIQTPEEKGASGMEGYRPNSSFTPTNTYNGIPLWGNTMDGRYIFS